VDVAPAQDTGSPTGFRACYFGAATPVRTAIYKSADIAPGLQVRGPAIIEEPTTTLVVFPGMSATMSAAGNYQLQI
jgi:N-methylhydantoinase A